MLAFKKEMFGTSCTYMHLMLPFRIFKTLAHAPIRHFIQCYVIKTSKIKSINVFHIQITSNNFKQCG